MAQSDRESIFRVWAPPGAAWSAWTKPVLFASLPHLAEAPALAADEAVDWPQADGTTTIVIDLPALRSISLGLAMAMRGYRPVPLFNALPGPSLGFAEKGPASAVDLWPAAKAIASNAERLSQIALPSNAPPAFLLDADRRGTRAVSAGDFDNRSVSLTTDFPSAAILGSAGISRVILISALHVVAADLAHTLLRWQKAGLVMQGWDPDLQQNSPIPLRISRPSGFGMMYQRLLAAMGLRPSPFGGFGATLPIPSAG